MNRNDKCFCESGKKYKKCHLTINKSSIAGELIMFYNELDKKIGNEIEEKNLKVACEKGCSECCADYFSITEVEFAVIIDYLVREKGIEYTKEMISKGLELKDMFKRNYPKYYEQLETNTTGYDNEMNMKININNMPDKQGFKCIFLDEQNQCSIYKVRPIICREHGICYYTEEPEHKLCSKIPSLLNNKSNMIDIEEYMDRIINFGYYSSSKERCKVERRKYPVFYLMKIYFEKELDLNHYLEHHVIKKLYGTNRENLADEILNMYNRR